MSQKVISKYEVQRWAKRQALGCEKILPGPAWLLLNKLCPLFSRTLYRLRLKLTIKIVILVVSL